jgi:hypothetical protein
MPSIQTRASPSPESPAAVGAGVRPRVRGNIDKTPVPDLFRAGKPEPRRPNLRLRAMLSNTSFTPLQLTVTCGIRPSPEVPHPIMLLLRRGSTSHWSTIELPRACHLASYLGQPTVYFQNERCRWYSRRIVRNSAPLLHRWWRSMSHPRLLQHAERFEFSPALVH